MQGTTSSVIGRVQGLKNEIMTLGFKRYFDKKKTQPTYFREKILAGANHVWAQTKHGFIPVHSAEAAQMFLLNMKAKPKLHTIREGNRWKAGDKIHMAYGVRTKNYKQFNQGIPELERVKSVQEIEIQWRKNKELFNRKEVKVFVDGSLIIVAAIHESFIGISANYNHIRGIVELSEIPTDLLCLNDGFDSAHSFFNWFNKDFQGQIIHWTDFRYV